MDAPIESLAFLDGAGYFIGQVVPIIGLICGFLVVLAIAGWVMDLFSSRRSAGKAGSAVGAAFGTASSARGLRRMGREARSRDRGIKFGPSDENTGILKAGLEGLDEHRARESERVAAEKAAGHIELGKNSTRSYLNKRRGRG